MENCSPAYHVSPTLEAGSLNDWLMGSGQGQTPAKPQDAVASELASLSSLLAFL